MDKPSELPPLQRGAGGNSQGRYLLAFTFLILGLISSPIRAQSPFDQDKDEDWRVLGSFAGSAQSNLGQKVWDLLIEMENDGNLYQDLGALSVGLGVDIGDDTKVDWDNYFTRRMYPIHEEIASGSELRADHVSRYLDLQTVVSRGRIRYAYIPDIVDTHGVDFQVEGGVSLSLARARDPLHLGDRPLEEALAQRPADDFRTLAEDFADDQREDLLYLGAKGTRAALQWAADIFGKRADTERGTLFWQGYGDPATVGFDLGVPVKVDLFSSTDDRLAPGDLVRHLTFIGISPVSMVLKEFGLRVEARYFLRYLRETTIVEEENDKVLVTVRNVGARGAELIPLKVRPEVRLLGLVKLAYTFFEERWGRGHSGSTKMSYRVDLANPRGRESLEAFLADGQSLSFKPLQQAAKERAGVEKLDWKAEEGDVRTGLRRVRIFTPLRYSNRKVTSIQTVQTEDLRWDELKVSRNSYLRKTWGKDSNWRRQFLLQSIVNPRPVEDQDRTPSELAAAMTILTTYQNSYADPDFLQRAATAIEHLSGPNPALEAFVEAPPGETQKAFVNLELSLATHHIEQIRSSSEDDAWGVLAEVLLGPEHRQEWLSTEGRAIWKRRRARSAFAASHESELEARTVPIPDSFDVHDRYRLAKRTVKKFRKALELFSDGDCTSCAHSAFRKWKDVTMLQIVLYRLSQEADGEEPGYHYEVFTDRMLRPLTITNQIRHAVLPGIDPESDGGLEIDSSLTAEDYDQMARSEKTDWFGKKYFLKPSDDRLQAGYLYKRETPDPSGESYCLKLRLFTDYTIEPGLSVRVDLRKAHTKTKDVTLKSALFRLDEPTEIVQTPFKSARYHYDVPIPFPEALELDEAHSLLVRILNPDGYPVSEEQQIRFRSYGEGTVDLAEGCKLGSAEEIAPSVEAADP